MGRVHDANLYASPTSVNLILRYIALKPEMSFGVEHHVRDSLNTRYPRFQYSLFGFHERTENLPALVNGSSVQYTAIQWRNLPYKVQTLPHKVKATEMPE
jgi:hypothetical protein